MNCNDALGILGKRKYRNCPKWLAYMDDHLGTYVIGFEASGKSTGSFSVFEAIAIAEKLERDASPTATGFSVPWNIGGCEPIQNSESLPPLEWRKLVDERIDTLESDEDILRANIANQAHCVLDWGNCVSDALKRIVAQDERIAKLEAKLAEFETTETVDCVVGRLEATEKRIAVLERRIETANAINGVEHDKFRSRLDRLDSSVFNMSHLMTKLDLIGDEVKEAVASTAEVQTVDALEQRIADIDRRLNDANTVGNRAGDAIDKELAKLDSRIDNSVEFEAHDALERRVTGLERHVRGTLSPRDRFSAI